MGFFEDTRPEAYDNAIANVKSLGSKASQEDRDKAVRASKVSGERGKRAQEALGKK